MRTSAPTRALTRRAAQGRTLAFFLAAVGVLVLMIGVVLSVIVLVPPASPSRWIYDLICLALIGMGLLVIGSAVFVLFQSFTIKGDNQLAQLVATELGKYLDDNFVLVRNVDDREIGYVDAILVGPPGLCVFRILDESGAYANEGANWLKLKRGTTEDWRPADIDATVEVVLDVNKTREYFQSRLGDLPTWGMICFIQPPSAVSLMAKEPVVPSTHLVTLHEALKQNYLAVPQRISPDFIPQIVSLLVPQ